MTKENFEVLRAGINTTYQDRGRENLNHIGIPFGGAMDNRNYQIANKLLNNKKNESVLEFAYQGPLLKFNGRKISIAITGDIIFNILRSSNPNTEKGNPYQSYVLNDGDQIDILSTNRSVYGYFAVKGGLKSDLFFGSSSTNTMAKVGGNKGEKLKKGDKIFINENKNGNHFENLKVDYINSRIQHIRFIKGTNYDYFSDFGKEVFIKSEFEVSKLSDRMGMRLKGPKIENIVETNIKSEGLTKGVIQVPADGNPIIMLSDHGTIGGYPKIGVVITADHDKLTQLTTGSKIKFQEVSLSVAENLFKIYNLETQNILDQIK